MDDGGPLVLVQPLQERGGVQGGARGAVPVVGVPLRGRVELPAEQIVRNRLRSVIVLGRRRGFLLVTPGVWRLARKLSSKRLLIALRV